MNGTLVLDDAALRELARRPELVAEFPELAGLAQAPRSCCGGGAARREALARLDRAKAAIARLSPPRARKFKQLAGAGRVEVWSPETPRPRLVAL